MKKQITQSKLKKWQKVTNYLIEDISLIIYLIFFLSITFLLGLVYYILTPYGHGLGQNANLLHNATFLQALYLSVITITTLGYSDIHPLGLSKAIASFEVLFGLSFFGIVIAKITSRRLSYHVTRLFNSDAQRRLEEFSVQFEIANEKLSEAMKNLGQVYQRTPAHSAQNQGMKDSALHQFKEALNFIHSKSEGLSKYFTYEVQHGNYFPFAPTEIMQKLGNIMNKGMYILTLTVPPF